MNQSDIPPRFDIPFANGAGASYIRTIPKAHQSASGTDAPASLTDGFPPETFTPVSGGGVPPNGKDVNGILNQVTQWARWQAAGGIATYNSAFSTAIGGYPKGAKLASTVTSGLIWTSTADGNTTNPDGGSPANWIPESQAGTGWFKIGSIVIQYGNAQQSMSGGQQFVTFPISFPNSCLWGIASNTSTTPPTAFHGVNGLTTTGMTVYSSTSAGVAAPAGVAFWWLALGT